MVRMLYNKLFYLFRLKFRRGTLANSTLPSKRWMHIRNLNLHPKRCCDPVYAGKRDVVEIHALFFVVEQSFDLFDVTVQTFKMYSLNVS